MLYKQHFYSAILTRVMLNGYAASKGGHNA